ncbi:MAG: hypothetical protein ACI9C4_001718 [Paraglaciecola sp.]|jgi:hypothetical protein
MLFFSKKQQEDEPHTIISTYLEQGKGRMETYYYGEAKAPLEPIENFCQLRVTKGASIQELMADYTWRAKIKSLVNKLTQKAGSPKN